MGASKANLFSDQFNRIARYTKAFAHPARIAICEYLLHNDMAPTIQIQKEIPLAPATIAQHIRVLRDASIITGFVDRNTIHYQLNASCFGQVQQFCEHFVTQLDKQQSA